MRLNHIMMSAALLGLAACGSGGDGNEKAAEGKSGAGKPAIAEVRLKPGQWEITHEIVSMEAPGMPEGAMAGLAGKKTTMRNCVTPEQAARPNADFFAAKDNGCSYKDFTMAGGRIQGTMTCSAKDSPGAMTMVMNGRYGGESYDMEVEMKTDSNAGSMTMKSRGAGRRIGECPPAQKS